MIKNSMGASGWMLLAAALLGAGCSRASAQAEEPLQGVVEFEQTITGFELGGRVERLFVEEGERVTAGTLLASLDDELTQSSLLARGAEADSARAELARVKSGARREDIGALAARVDAAKASEALIEKNLTRQRALFESKVVALASVDELEGQLARASAERRSLEQNLLALRRGARSEEVGVAAARAEAVEAAAAVDRVRLERHELRAPVAAEVLEVHALAGEVVGAGSAVITLGDTAHPYVDVFVAQGKLAGIAVGNAASVRVDAEPKALSGRVEHVAQKTEFTPRFLFSERERPNLVVRVRVRIDDAERRLHAGVPAFVSIAARGQ
jgi:HlyD family secretion protein